MTITFNPNGSVSLPNPTLGNVPMLVGNPTDMSSWMQLQPTGSATGGPSNAFMVPVGKPQPTTTYKQFDQPANRLGETFIPGISAAETVMAPPTQTNEQIKNGLLLQQAEDPEGYKTFLEAMKNSGYSDVDDMLYGAALVGEDWQEFLYRRASSGLFGDGGGGGGPTTTVTTNISNTGQAFNTVDPEFQRGLGRGIGTDELKDFRKTLNQFERDNPYVTTSGTGFSKTTGGFNPSELVSSYVRGQEDYAESQVAMNFLGVLDRVLKDPSSQPGPDLQERMERSGY